VDDLCAPGSRGRKRGEGVRTRTTMSQARSSQWLGRFGNRGHGLSRTQLRQGLAAIRRSLTSHPFPQEHTLLRLDGHSGNGAVLTDLAGVAFVTRGKDSSLLDHPLVQARQHVPPDQLQQRPESQMVHSLSGGPPIPAEPEGVPSRVVMVAHPAGKQKSPIGVTRAGVVSERFFTNLPHHAFTACDVVAWSVHRAAFEPILSDEDQKSDPDRWCSHSAWGQEAWQCVTHWVWNLRLEPGQHLHPDPRRTTACASALPPPSPPPPFLWLCSSRGGFRMEGWPLLGPRCHAPPGRDASLPSKPGASCSRAATRR
jgi:hypothetical protein